MLIMSEPILPTQRPAIVASAIPFSHWSMRMARGGQATAWGEIVDQLADVEQGIANIVLTPIGSVPTEPDKGCDILTFLDRPPAIAIPGLKETIWEGLFKWHKRIRLEAVDIVPVVADEAGLSHFRAPIFWYPVDGVIEQPLTTVVDVTRGQLLAGVSLLQ